MKKQSVNTFNKGLVTDYSNLNTPNDIVIDALNARYTTYNGNEFIIQPDKGNVNEECWNLPQGFKMVGVKTYLNIAYILSVNENTGLGQIGTFPSPSYYDYILKDSGTTVPNTPLNLVSDVYTNTDVYSIQLTGIGNVVVQSYHDGQGGTYEDLYIGEVDGYKEVIAYTLSEIPPGYSFIVTSDDTLQVEVKLRISKEEGNLEKCYRPLQNWLIQESNDAYFERLGNFETGLLNFDCDWPVHDVEIQPSYDGTVNIIFTDSVNPPRIINSRFTQLEGNRFKIVDRTGTNDDNIYGPSNFETKGNLFLRSNEIPVLTYLGQNAGGSLKPGMYRYYFVYETQDGNYTDVVEESGNVAVYFGNTVSTIRGGDSNELTNKAVNFRLSRRDPSFSYVRVIVAYSAGTPESITEVYMVDKRYTSLDISHTGFEPILSYSSTELNNDLSSIKTFRTMCQVNNRLLIANIKENVVDNVSEYKDLAESFKLSSVEQDLTIDGVNSISDLPFDLVTEDHGYRHHNNVYSKLGYWGAESYAFGVVFILNDGSLSPVFPMTGIDDRYTGRIYTTSQYDSDGWNLTGDPNTNASYGQNNKGVYRFPRRTSSTIFDGSNVKINALEVNLPTDLLTDPNYLEVKSKSKGLFFVRAERVKDCIVQGYVLPTYSVSLTNFGEFDKDFYGNNQPGAFSWKDIYDLNDMLSDSPNTWPSVYPPDDSDYWSSKLRKVIPTVRGYIEGTEAILNNDGDDRYYDANLAIFRETMRDVYRWGLYSADYDTKPSEYIYLNNNDIYVSSLFTVKGVSANTYEGKPGYDVTLPNNSTALPTLYKTSLINEVVDINANGFSTEPFKSYTVFDATEAVNDRFSSRLIDCRLQELVEYPEIRDLSLGRYIGLKLITSDPATNVRTSSVPTNIHSTYIKFSNVRDVSIIKRWDFVLQEFSDVVPRNIAQLVNIYPQYGPISTSILKDRYRPENLSYFPISNRMTFNDFENKIVNNTITLFGGDCYLGSYFKKIMWGDDSEAYIDPEKSNTNKAGYGLHLIHEMNHNPYLRTIQPTNNDTFKYYPYDLGTDVKSYFRDDKTTETQLYNDGYSFLNGSKIYLSRDFTLPYIEDSFDTRIMYSELHVRSNFANGYRNFKGLNFEDYSRHIGAIVKIVNSNGKVLSIQENGITYIPISERIQTGNGEGGPIYVDNPYVLPSADNVAYISEEYGSQHQSSIVKSNNLIYGVDAYKGRIWRFNNKQLEILSDFKVNSLISNPLYNVKGLNPKILKHDVKGIFNDNENTVMWSVYVSPEYCTEEPYYNGLVDTNLVLSFNEALNIWQSRYSYSPYNGFNIGSQFYTLNRLEDNNKIWEHSGLPYLYYANNEHTFEFEYLLQDSPYEHKLFTNLVSACNKYVPTKVLYNTDLDSVEQTLVYREDGNILRYSAAYKEDHLYIVMPKSYKEKYIRDKYIKIRFVYTGNEPHIIHSVITKYLTSSS